MLKKYQYVFVFLFLGSMLFTVFQYVPILEEEIHSSKTMTKKSDNPQDGSSGDDDNDTDDSADEFFKSGGYDSITLYSSLHQFHNSTFYLFNSPLSIQTPPPKI